MVSYFHAMKAFLAIVLKHKIVCTQTMFITKFKNNQSSSPSKYTFRNRFRPNFVSVPQSRNSHRPSSPGTAQQQQQHHGRRGRCRKQPKQNQTKLYCHCFCWLLATDSSRPYLEQLSHQQCTATFGTTFLNHNPLFSVAG